MKKKQRTGRLLLVVLLCCVLCIPTAIFAASGDPALRFGLSTSSAVTGLKEGDRIEVRVSIEREDGFDEPYSLASLLMDIDYDNELFAVSQLKTCGLKRPDGQNWIGGWTCSTIPSGKTGKQVRVLYFNMTGLMSNPPKLDSVSGSLQAASFVLTVIKDSPGMESTVAFSFVENGDAMGKESPSISGEPLKLQFAGGEGGNGDSSSGGNSGENGSGEGTGGSSDSEGDSGSDGTGSQGGDSAGSDGNSGSNNNSGSGSNSGSGGSSGTGGSSGSGTSSGTPADGSTPTGTGQGHSSAGRVAFSELTDVPADHWASQYIEALVTKGVLSGNEKKQFEPEKPVTRAEFCQMIASAFGYRPQSDAAQSAKEAFFMDVAPTDWYYSPVTALYEAGVVSGMGDGMFGAEDTLSRQDMAVVLYRVQKDQNMVRSMIREYAVFSDQFQVEDYARQALMDMYCTGLISGTDTSTLAPQDNSTRAQAATVLYKMLEEGERR